ncbi:GntR family transcriptional regulator [Acaricomes phytoseiuli]|uniref:GntR family transcriptional regulator n=1 Tax=Acaricomes phytoseiuli TaxID=291968 RepID=UPI0022224CA5|nr:GntR family transcriptional regulator [Acaricomes phytoseiuli]MCW1250367.1 GntR family transcriptional regulator [Acaricomes phytoseiuli]
MPSASASDRKPALWKKVQASLRERVLRGEFSSGFPGELVLAEEYRVSRSTIRAALAPLRREGLVSASPGRRSEVNIGVGRNVYGPVYSLFDAVQKTGMEQTNVVEAARLVTDPVAARILQLDPAEDVVYIARIRMADGAPIAADKAWFPVQAQDVLAADLRHIALYDALERYSLLTISHAEETMRAISLDHERAQRLDTVPGAPAFSLERIGYSGDRVLEWRKTVARGDRFSVTTTYP